jgi:class 3 adenylate cyclase
MIELRETGLDAARRNDWRRGYDILRQWVSEHPDDADALLWLGECGSWLQMPRESAECREHAYHEFFARGDLDTAARLALKLAVDYGVTLMEPAVGQGWFQRAADLLDGKPPSPAHAALLLARAGRAEDAQEALGYAEQSIELARRFGDHDTETLALCRKGVLLVGTGQIADGLRLQDAALAAAVGGELGPLATILVYCWLIACCERLGDVERASGWSETAIRYCEKASIVDFPGVCRLHLTRVLKLRGAWAEAEAEARRAADATRPLNPSVAAAALAEIAEIRRRKGDVDGAWEMAQQAKALGGGPDRLVALIVAEREGVEAAYYTLEKALRASSKDRTQRALIIPAFTEVAIACRRADAAVVDVAELEELATMAGTNVLRGYARGTRGRLQLAQGDARGARDSFEAAIEAWTEARVPYERARDRLGLADALLALGNRVGAETEAREAKRELEELGAAPEARRAGALLAKLSLEPAVATATAATFMFTDLVGSTALIEAIGDDAWRDVCSWLESAMRRAFAEHRGREIDHAGDGFFVSFASASDAIGCAQLIQRRLAAHRKEHGYAPQVRIGIHAGRAIAEGGAVRGAAVHRTSRICAIAEGGEIVASREALEAGGYARVELRSVALRGVRGTVEVGSIEWTAEPVN